MRESAICIKGLKQSGENFRANNQHEELRSSPELLERHLRHHHEPPTRCVSFPQSGFLGNDLDVRFVPQDTVLSKAERVGIRFGGSIEVFGGEEGSVDVIEGMERDAVLRDDGEVIIGRIVEYSGCKEASGGGDKRCRSPESAFGVWDEAVAENVAGRGSGHVDGGVGVDVDVEKRSLACRKKRFQRGRKWRSVLVKKRKAILGEEEEERWDEADGEAVAR
ncbi:hypothetical protein F3Y22_tig00110294pilonHSYRG00033 [Hibiscus syriacus]|uniref:Uncharacterized protein n=1 Tax=Hibiscus syriacus TaxID=106335 RepID=A0A6A3B315_HIBSY|nr:hypothetical protein F3Y22_tig00110294pilonHSYRG00033 [Hibiscus syriacus]